MDTCQQSTPKLNVCILLAQTGLFPLSLPNTFMCSCVKVNAFWLTELALGPGQGPLPPGPLRQENMKEGREERRKERKWQIKMVWRDKKQVPYISLEVYLHVHSWHGAAHGVGRRPHTSIILKDTKHCKNIQQYISFDSRQHYWFSWFFDFDFEETTVQEKTSLSCKSNHFYIYSNRYVIRIYQNVKCDNS